MTYYKLTTKIFLILSFLFAQGSLFAETTIQNETTNILVAKAKSSESTKAPVEEDFTEDDEDIIEVSDPFESINRKIFSFNDKVYVYALKPIARGFRAVIPENGRVATSNFFSNLLAPLRMVNASLQLKGEDATNETFRFLINTTLGLGGLFDVAKKDFKIKIKKEDFGQTLGHYNVANGPYLVLPFFGPSSVRDGVGLLVDGAYLDAVSYIYDDETGRYLLVKLIDIETTLSLDKDTYEAIKKDALDPYIFIRNAYIQHRAGAVEK